MSQVRASLLGVAKGVLGPLYPGLRQHLKGWAKRNVPIHMECGVTLRGDLRDATWARLARQGHHEPATDRFFADYLQAGNVVIDVGAQVGIYTSMASLAVGPRGMVFAFDIDPQNLVALRRTIRRNCLHNVHVVPQAAGKEEADVTFLRPNMSWGAFARPTALTGDESAKNLAIHSEVERSSQVDLFQARTTTLDQFVDLQALSRVDLIKIDVDGMEFEVLQGAERVLALRRPAIIYEDSEYARDRGCDFCLVYEYLTGLDYVVYGSLRQSAKVRPILSADEKWVRTAIANSEDVNLFCLPAETFDESCHRVWFATPDDKALKPSRVSTETVHSPPQPNHPRVSVVIPTFNRRRILEHSINSVLSQTFKDLEIVVVDDGSTDGTGELIASIAEPRLRYFRQRQLGPAAARNAGVEASRGELIAFQDSDDIWLNDKLQRQVDLLDTRPEVGWVYCDMSFFGSEQAEAQPSKFKLRPPVSGSIMKEIFTAGHPMSTPTVVVRRCCFEQAGGFDETLIVAEDVDLWLRLASISDVDYVDDVLVRCRREVFPKAHRNTGVGLAANCLMRNRLIDEHPDMWEQCIRLERYAGYYRFVFALVAQHLQDGRPDDARRVLQRFGGRLSWMANCACRAGTYAAPLFIRDRQEIRIALASQPGQADDDRQNIAHETIPNMPRVGRNPMKSAGRPYGPQKVTLITAVYIPELTGYWEESLDVLKVCLESAFRNTSHPYDLMVFDNGSCAQVREYLQRLHDDGEIQFLFLSHENVGKVGCWNITFPAAAGEYIAWFDSDVRFAPDWLEESMAVFEAFEDVGMVTARPGRLPGESRDDFLSSTLAYAQSGADGLHTEQGQLVDKAILRDHFRSLGIDENTVGFPEYDVRMSRNGVSVFAYASHFQFVTTRKIAREILPIAIGDHPLGSDRMWDVELNRRGYLRLALDEPLVEHLGNRLQQEEESPVSEDSRSNNGSNRKGKGQRSFAARVCRRVLTRLHSAIGSILYS